MDTQKDIAPITIQTVHGVKTLYVGGKSQSAMDIANPQKNVFFYTQFFLLPLLAISVKRALFIGGGGFSGPKFFAAQGIDVTVVELYPQIVDIAKKDFGLDASHMTIHVGDGREFLEKTIEKYDVIIVDAFVVDKIPRQFITTQWFMLVANHLSENGFLVMNTITAPRLWFFESLHKTIRSSFSHICVFDAEATSIQTKNILFVASQKAFSLDGMKQKSQMSLYSDTFGDLQPVFDSVLSDVNDDGGDILFDSDSIV